MYMCVFFVRFFKTSSSIFKIKGVFAIKMCGRAVAVAVPCEHKCNHSIPFSPVCHARFQTTTDLRRDRRMKEEEEEIEGMDGRRVPSRHDATVRRSASHGTQCAAGRPCMPVGLVSACCRVPMVSSFTKCSRGLV
jgi:hypothetical protein